MPTRQRRLAAPPRLTGHLQLDTGSGGLLGDTRVRLLEAIARCGSITAAAKEVPLSYKAAWDAIDAMNNLSTEPLVERSSGGRGGGGTTLTPHGLRLIALYRAVEAEYQAALDRLAPQLGAVGDDAQALRRLLRSFGVRSSARNQFAGSVCGLRQGEVDFEVRVQLDPSTELVAVITRESAEQLGLVIGSSVVALVKAPSVLIVADPALRLSARNQFWGTVRRIVQGAVNAEIALDLDGGRSAVAVLPAAQLQALGLAEGDRACAAFKVSSVILHALD